MKKSLRLIAGAGLAVATAGALSAGCDTLENLLPPGGSVAISYISSGTSEFAGVSAYFVSDFVANDPADDPSINPYEDLGIGDCVPPIQAGSGTSQYTYVDAGDVNLAGPLTLAVTKVQSGSDLYYETTLDPSTYPFNQFVDVELTGSTEIEATTFTSALATGDLLDFSAPAEMHGTLVTFPGNADLTFTYASVASEIMIISITDAAGTTGLTCRVDPGAGGEETFVLPATEVGNLPTNGSIVALTYSFREDTLNIGGEDRSVSFIGQTVRAVQYQKN